MPDQCNQCKATVQRLEIRGTAISVHVCGWLDWHAVQDVCAPTFCPLLPGIGSRDTSSPTLMSVDCGRKVEFNNNNYEQNYVFYHVPFLPLPFFIQIKVVEETAQ